MYCTQCGTRLAEASRFCSKCGHQVGTDQPIEDQHFEFSPTSSVKSQNKRKWKKATIICTLVVIVIVVFTTVIISKISTPAKPIQQTMKTATLPTPLPPTPTPDNTLCSGDTSGSPLASGTIDSNHPFREDDGQAGQGDQGSFSPISLCNNIATSHYEIKFHAQSPYILLYLYDSKHAKYEIDYDIYPDHISVLAHPGFSIAGNLVGDGTYSSADWHTYQIEFTSDSVRVLVDGTEVVTGSVGFTDDGTGDNLLLQSHKITMDQFSVTAI